MTILAIPAEDTSGLTALRSCNIEDAPYFAILEITPIGGMFLEGVANTAEDLDGIVALMKEHQVDAVLSVAVSVPAALALGDAEISVYREKDCKTVGDAGKAYEFSERQARLNDM